VLVLALPSPVLSHRESALCAPADFLFSKAPEACFGMVSQCARVGSSGYALRGGDGLGGIGGEI
jgi:hypothetical protein